MKAARILIAVSLLALVVIALPAGNAFAQGMQPGAAAPVDPEGLQRLQNDMGGQAKVSLSPATGAVRFLSLPPQLTDPILSPVGAETTLAAKAKRFFGLYGSVFGIQDASSELQSLGQSTDGYGNTRLAFVQAYGGVPVYAGVLYAHFDNQQRLRAVNGVFAPGISLYAQARLSMAEAETRAVMAVAENGKSPEVLKAAGSQLYIYRHGLIQGIPGPDYLVYRVEVTGEGVREIVFVDAHKGDIVNRFSGIEDSLSRELYEPSVSPGNLKWKEGDTFPTGDVDWDNILYATKEAYNFFGSMTNGAWLSYDNADAVMKSVAAASAISCPNANWNGASTNFCDGVTADDVVAHEWAHAYTDYTHDLIYQWQPGALNESYSDIFGEAVDFINARGTDSPVGNRTADGSKCSRYASNNPSTDDSYRWLMGEDAPAFGPGPLPNAIRDMWRPECFSDPGKVSSSSYTCSVDDGGGVHTNSGVPNHAFALLVDGGAYNGQTITGIGLTKAAHIYWRAMTTYQTPATDFADHADAIEQSCSDLVGVNLNQLTTANPPYPGPGATAITSADCTELHEVMLAVEMRNSPSQCNFQPLLNPNAPALCSGGQGAYFIYANDFEAGSAGWVPGRRAIADPASFDNRDWSAAGALPGGRAGSALFGPDPVVGDCADDDESGVIYIDSPTITVPGSVSVPLGSFMHYVATEMNFDGGNLKASVNGGAFNLVGSSAFTFNPYNGALDNSVDNTDPLRGEAAFHGTDGGVVTGSWGQSQLNLDSLLNPNDTVKFRFELGSDGCNGLDGWYVDNFQMFYCAPCAAPAIPSAVVAKVGADVQLSWTHNSVNAQYKVYRSANPYFLPGDPGVTETAVLAPFAATVTYVDAGAANNPGQNFYYLVLGTGNCGDSTANNSEQANFKFSLTPGAS